MATVYKEITNSEFLRLLRRKKEIPENLIVDGPLYLSGKKISKLPNNLWVKGHLDISHTDIKRLPKKLYVLGYLYLEGSKITHLPNDLKLGYNIVVYNGVTWGKKEYNALRKDENVETFIFSRKDIITIKKLLYIPELFQNVYYDNKKHFISLLAKI